MVFYDPRMLKHDYFALEITREEMQERVDQYLAYEQQTLEEVDAIVNELSFLSVLVDGGTSTSSPITVANRRGKNFRLAQACSSSTVCPLSWLMMPR